MVSDLLMRSCSQRGGDVSVLSPEAILEFTQELKNKWDVVDNQRLHREFNFKDFTEAMVFVNDVAALAEAEGHHPDLVVKFGHVSIDLTTHSAGGLTENDFILARKIEVCC